MTKKLFILFFLLSVRCPLSAVLAASPGDVVINELMWMGTAASSSDEWVELYNNTDQDIDLTNWTLKSEDGTPLMILTSTITAKGYYLLERTDDNTIKDIAADKIYSGALSDTGESLVLFDSYTVVMDSAPCSSGWFAGAKAPNYSMERMNPKESGWLTANWGNNNGIAMNGLDANSAPVFATPKAKNSVYYDGAIGDDNDPGNPAVDYQIRITEVAFAASIDWVELYNYGETAVDIANFMLTDLDGTDTRIAAQKTTLAPGKYAVVFWDDTGLDETDDSGDLNNNGFVDLYVNDTGLSATDDELVLMSASSGGQFIDAVCWSTGLGEFSSSEDKDVKLLADNGQWSIAGDTVTKSDCWSDASKVTSGQAIGRLAPAMPDTDSKNDWYLFKWPTPGQDNPSLTPPGITLLFDPEPPFKDGQVKISLHIETVNSIIETPQLSFSEGAGGFQDIALNGEDKNWQGIFEISQDETERTISLKYKVIDHAKNSVEQELMYLGLAYVPPEYGERMYCFPNPWVMNSGQPLKFSNLGIDESAIKIFTLHGELVKKLTGQGDAYWDGTNENGEKVAAGIYIYCLENSQIVKKGKFAVLK